MSKDDAIKNQTDDKVNLPSKSLKVKKNINIESNAIPTDLEEQLIKLALIYHSQGNIIEAEKSYKNIIKKGISNPIIFYNYGVILKDRSNLKKAEENILLSINLKPDFPESYFVLSEIQFRLNKFIDANKSIIKAIKINKNNYKYHYLLSSILLALKRFKDAEISLKETIILNPNHFKAHSNLSGILRKSGKLNEAEISIRHAIKLSPISPEHYFNLGNILRDKCKLNEAEISMKKAIKLKYDYPSAHNNLGNILNNLGKLNEAKMSIEESIKIKPNNKNAYWNLCALSNNILEAEENIIKCLEIDKNYLNAKLIHSALKFHQGDKSLFNELMETSHKNHPFMRTFKWVLSLPELPKLFFHRWALFDAMIKKSNKNRPFYEFGVWRGDSFKYLIKTFKKGYGFDTFQGLPEDWHHEKKGTYSAEGLIPKINGGTFIVGKFEDTLPTFFIEPRPIASIINFDADLYSSTLCALNHSKPIIDQNTILIFDEFIINNNWEEDEYKSLNEFCASNNLSYEVLALSYTTKQTAVKLIGI